MPYFAVVILVDTLHYQLYQQRAFVPQFPRKELEEFVAGIQQEIERMKQQTAERKKELKQAQENELNGKGADTVTIRKYDDRLAEINKELDYIGKSRPQVLYYERDKEELFDKEPATRSRKKEQDAKLVALDERFALKKEKLQVQKKGADEHLDRTESFSAARTGFTNIVTKILLSGFCNISMPTLLKSTLSVCGTQRRCSVAAVGGAYSS